MSERWLVVLLFLSGCVASTVYIDFCYPCLLPGIASLVLPAHARLSLAPPEYSACSASLLGINNLRDGFWFALFSASGVMTMWSFLMAVHTDPGRVPVAFRHGTPKASVLALKVTGGMHSCQVCSVYKPARAHHCSRCMRCVLKYDHHCPWIGQCVGFFNYKLYLLFVGYTHVFTVIITASLGSSLLRLALGGAVSASNPWLRALSELPIGSTYASEKAASVPIVATYLLAIVFQLLTLYLIPKHLRFARHNTTTVDQVIKAQLPDEELRGWVNMYDVGVKENLESIFGDGSWSAEARRRGVGEGSDGGGENWVAVWCKRLVPVPAYRSQCRQLLDDVSALDSAIASNYGSTETPRRKEDQHRRSHDAYALLRNDKFLGLVYPVDSQQAGRYHS